MNLGSSSVYDNFFNKFGEKYGQNARRHLKIWTTTNQKLTHAYSQRQFLLRCRTHDTRPANINNITRNLNHFYFHSKSGKDKFNKLIKHFKQKTLNVEIQDINIHVTP